MNCGVVYQTLKMNIRTFPKNIKGIVELGPPSRTSFMGLCEKAILY